MAWAGADWLAWVAWRRTMGMLGIHIRKPRLIRDAAMVVYYCVCDFRMSSSWVASWLDDGRSRSIGLFVSSSFGFE